MDIDARVAILEALVAMKADAAKTGLTEALADREWAVRLKARTMLRTADPASTAEPERPTGTRLDLPEYAALGAPSGVAARLHRHVEGLKCRLRSPSWTRR